MLGTLFNVNEAHNIKNRNTKAVVACCELEENYRCGTPYTSVRSSITTLSCRFLPSLVPLRGVVFLEDNYKLPDAIPSTSLPPHGLSRTSGLIATDATVIGFKATCAVSAPVRGWRWT